MSLSTATTDVRFDFAHDRLLQALALVCAAAWVWASIAPVDRTTWMLENILLISGVVAVALIDRGRHAFSHVSHILLAAFFLMHVVGTHYEYSNVPLGQWVKDAFDLERNHYDRMVHLFFGVLLAYPVREFIMRRTALRGFASYFFTFVVLVAASEIYELIEWLTAMIVDPEAGMAFLGTQGDPFDAQKDTGLALCGTVFALAVTRLAEGRR